MLRRLSLFVLAVFLVGFAFSLAPPERHPAPTAVATAQPFTDALHVVATLLPRVAIAQEVVYDTTRPRGSAPAVAPAPVADTASVSVSTVTTRTRADHSFAILWTTLALIVVVCLGVWFVTRRPTNGNSYSPSS